LSWLIQGCDGSVLLDSITVNNAVQDSEKEGAPNKNSLRGFEVIDEAKANIEKVCPWVVSCADVVSYAARDSIVLGGGKIPFGLWLGGRKDGDVSLAAETLTNLPAPFSDFPTLTAAFQAKGLNQQEMVILSGEQHFLQRK
jgi:peroxidase